MNCPDCGLPTRVIQTETEAHIVLRRRRCANNHMTYTQERVVYSKPRGNTVPRRYLDEQSPTAG